MQEKTIARSITCSGIGLHSGQKVALGFYPLPAGSGVLWSVKGKAGSRLLEINPQHVVDTTLCTTIGHDDVRVGTVEHVMAAVRGMDIDNILIEVDGPEVPIMDGSAASFVHLFHQAGLKDQKRYKMVYVVTQTVGMKEKGKSIMVQPDHAFRVRYAIDFPHPMVGHQEMQFAFDSNNFVQELARARTFGFLSDVKALQRQGKAMGGSLENALVFDQTGAINADGFRYPNEPVRHKILDLIGDIGLLPHPIVGFFDVHCSGHALNTAFAGHLFENKEKYLRLVSLRDLRRCRKDIHVPESNTCPSPA